MQNSAWRYIFVPIAICEGVTMIEWDRVRFTLPALLASIATFAFAASTQEYPKQTQLPNPYRLEENWPTLPKDMNGGKWGELIRADIDPKGDIWVFHRCFNTEPAGAATCVGRSEPPILK